MSEARRSLCRERISSQPSDASLLHLYQYYASAESDIEKRYADANQTLHVRATLINDARPTNFSTFTMISRGRMRLSEWPRLNWRRIGGEASAGA
jgi:hypothetical protein